MDSTEDFQKLLNHAYFYLKFRPRSKKEVKDYLLKKIKTKHWSTTDVEKVLERLEELKFIDDKEFTRWFIEQRNILKPKSQYVLSQELYRFGVAKEIVEEYFSNTEVDELELAKKAISTKRMLISKFSDQKIYQKALNFLLRRGFSYDTAKQTLNYFKEDFTSNS